MSDFFDALLGDTGAGGIATLAIAIFGSLVGSIVGPFLTARWQASHDHQRFVREQTLSLHAEVMAYLMTLDQAVRRNVSDPKILRPFFDQSGNAAFADLSGRLYLLSPMTLYVAFEKAREKALIAWSGHEFIRGRAYKDDRTLQNPILTAIRERWPEMKELREDTKKAAQALDEVKRLLRAVIYPPSLSQRILGRLWGARVVLSKKP